MKHGLLILLFCLHRAFAQVGPPDLRCLQVLPNGDVSLSWIPPTDPNASFYAYEIYESVLSAGPYSLVSTLPGSIFTSNTVVSGVNANTQSRYFFMRTLYGSGGTSKSANSDTLRTLFVNVNTVPECLKIACNQLHQPPLPSSGQLTVLKEFPIGTWNTFSVTSSLNTYDTLSVCQATINYQVTILDNSGCTSKSNIQGGTNYNDSKRPDAPVVDSISVLPNGNVILTWLMPREQDVVRYTIYQGIIIPPSTAVSNVPIDTLKGRTNTAYTFTATGSNYESVMLFVAAEDSCNNLGLWGLQPKTMYLSSTYNQCEHTASLSWNSYDFMPAGNPLLEYHVYYSVDGGAFTEVGRTTDTKFTHDSVAPSKNICYYVRAFSTNKLLTSSSNQICFFSRQVNAPAFVYMRKASVVGKNNIQIKLLVDTSQTCKGIDMFRSVDSVNYQSIGFVPNNGTPNYVYTDNEVSPDNNSYYYKAVVKDSCGNARATSNVSRTMLLKVVEDKEFIFTKHLSWSDYKGFNGGISGYNVYRVINDVVQPDPVGSVGLLTTVYTDDVEDEASSGSKIDYLVEAVEGLGNTYGFMENSLSNQRPVYLDGKIFVPSAFAPGGINKVWLPVTHFIDKAEYHVTVFNRWGGKVFETSEDNVGWNGSDAPPGIYAYLITYKNSRGEYQELTGTVLLYK